MLLIFSLAVAIVKFRNSLLIVTEGHPMSVCVSVEPATGRSSCPVDFPFNISINIMDMTTGLLMSFSNKVGEVLCFTYQQFKSSYTTPNV